jgi:hypothetical protein
MQFQVPQYIDVEDRIVGPLTLKQFFYIATGFLLIFVTFFVLATWLWLITSTIIAAASLALALVKYNGRPLLTITTAALRYYFNARVYAWQKDGEGEDAPPQKGLLSRLGLGLMTGTHIVRPQKTNINTFFSRSLPAQERLELVRRQDGDKSVAKRIDYR